MSTIRRLVVLLVEDEDWSAVKLQDCDEHGVFRRKHKGYLLGGDCRWLFEQKGV